MQEPPPITIRNPGAPSDSLDVIGREPAREPRRLTGRQKRLSLLAAVIVAVGGAGAWGVAHVQHERELDAASARSVHLLSIPSSVSSYRGEQTQVGLGFLNLGDEPVTVRSVRYEAPGFPELRPATGTVPVNDPTFLTFPLSGPCPTLAPVVGDEGSVVVRLRTARGVDTSVRLKDDGALGLGSDYASTVASQCHIYSPGDSLVADDDPAITRVGQDLRLVWTVHNQSAYARRLLGARITGGLQVVNAIAPFRLDYNEEHRLEVRLRVASCADAEQSWAFALVQQGTTPAFQAVNADGALSLVVEGDGRTEDAASFVLPGQLQEVQQWVDARCPATEPADR